MATSRFVHRSAPPVALLLPDLDCEGRGYWQQQWLASRIDCRAVDLGQGRMPDRNDYVSRLDHALRGIDAPVILVGHGVGALTIAAWSNLMSGEGETAVAGALLIAPRDPCGSNADGPLRSFTPLPGTIFAFPALVVASDDDPELPIERAFTMARQWGAGFARFESCGHFRPHDGLGCWAEGEELLDRFADMIEPGAVRPLVDIDEWVGQPVHHHRHDHFMLR